VLGHHDEPVIPAMQDAGMGGEIGSMPSFIVVVLAAIPRLFAPALNVP
jgi:hypothetical protein